MHEPLSVPITCGQFCLCLGVLSTQASLQSRTTTRGHTGTSSGSYIRCVGLRPYPAPTWGLSCSASVPSQVARAVTARVKAQSHSPLTNCLLPVSPLIPHLPFHPPQEAALQNLSLYSVVKKKSPDDLECARGERTKSPRCKALGAAEQECGSVTPSWH